MHKEIYNTFYTIDEFELFLQSKGITLSEFKFSGFRNALKTYFKDLSNIVLKKCYAIRQDIRICKEFVESLDWKFFKFLSSHNLQSKYRDLIFYSLEGYIPITVAAIITECTIEMLEKRHHLMDSVERFGVRCFKYEDVNKWLKFKESHIVIDEIYTDIVKKIDKEKQGKERYYRNKILELYDDGAFDKYEPVKSTDTIFRTKIFNTVFVNSKYRDEVYEKLKIELNNQAIDTFGSKKDRFKLRLDSALSNADSKKIKITLNQFSNFAISRLSEITLGPQPFIDVLNLIDNLDKELMLYTTEEVTNLIDTLPTKSAKREFTNFTKFLRNFVTTTYGNIDYDFTHTGLGTKPRLPYTEEQYQRFGFLVLSDSHIWYEDYMKKALEKRSHAATWLYAVLHYICAWRSGDITKQLPRPNLRMKPKDFLEKVKSKKLTKEEALDIVEQVNMKLHLWNLKPSKTKSNTTPSLVMEIPESLFEFLGTLIGITEAHFQLSCNINKKYLIGSDSTKRDAQVDFFGEEFVSIFGEDYFKNSRAVKNYEMIMSKKADEKELGTGYMIASIARAHKFKLDKKATTTMVYLRYYKNMEDSEIILSELFERGVCSFVPYLLTKIISGEEEILKLPHKDKTKKIKELSNMTPYELEMVMQGYDLALEHSKLKINEIVQGAISDGLEPKEIAKDMLLNIIHNEAPSKQGDIPCMIIAQGKNCIYPKRENCVGCGNEIYLKSCLFELGNRIKKAKTQAAMSQTIASRNKNILMIKNVLSPIVSEIFITLKEVYKIENLEEFKKLIQ